MSDRVVLSRFARRRLFPADGRRNAITGTDAAAFEAYLNEHEPEQVLDGYASFCKLCVYRNWTTTRCAAIPITNENRHLLRSGYEARNSKELPVLVRWFEGLEAPIGEFLMVILYDREQMAREGDRIKGDWAVVGCLATMKAEATPLNPITMLRNALGVEEGGSGVPIDREAYLEAVEYWDAHANWRDSATANS